MGYFKQMMLIFEFIFLIHGAKQGFYTLIVCRSINGVFVAYIELFGTIIF